MSISIQTADFDVSTELANLHASRRDVGALVSFVGTVRETNAGSTIRQMALEHYPGMTEKSLENIVQQAKSRWEVIDVVVIHRVGVLPVGAQIVFVAVATQHRSAAFEACEFILDFLKTAAPFWKKEIGDDGEKWVDARVSDLSALNKWEWS